MGELSDIQTIKSLTIIIVKMDAHEQKVSPPNNQAVEPTRQPQAHQPQPPVKKPPLLKQSLRYKLLQKMQTYFDTDIKNKLSHSFYNTFSIIEPSDPDRQKFTTIFKGVYAIPKEIKPDLLGLDLKVERGVACFLGLAICDALGASTQFTHFEKERRDLIAYDFDDVIKQIQYKVLSPRSGKVGIWTDDCSMALCMADSLLLNKYNFDAKHMRYMFHMWLEHGLNNGGRPHSIGLGGNISISMGEFVHNRQEYTAEGDKFNNGNGSLMRLAPIPLCFVNDEAKSMQMAQKQSRTTHNGDQAKQCSKLLTLILVRLINRGAEQDWKSVIEKACSDFVKQTNPMKTVLHLALSEQEPLELYEQQLEQYKRKFKKFNQKPEDRNWNWKDPNYTYSQCRAKDQPGYIGSYCMDALCMALHTVWHSKSFEEIALINANMGGDCDTVGAIAGQLGGAIYGISPYMLHLYGQMEDVKTGRFDVFLKAYKLMTHNPI